MRKKAPGERFKTLTASIPPELYDAFVSRAEQDRINKSELVKSWVEAWLSGAPIPTPGESSPSPAIDLEQLKQEIKAEVLISLSPVAVTEEEPKPEPRKVTPDQAQLPIVTPDQETHTPVTEKPDKVLITEDVRAELIAHFNELNAAGMKDADISRAVDGKKSAIVSLIRYEMDNPKRQKAITSDRYASLKAVRPAT